MNRLQGIWYINTNRHEISARTDSAFLKISGWQLMAVVIFSLKKLILFLSYFTFRFFKALFIDGFVIHAKHRLFRAKGTKNYLCTGLIFVNSLLISLSLKKSQYRFFNANICKTWNIDILKYNIYVILPPKSLRWTIAMGLRPY